MYQLTTRTRSLWLLIALFLNACTAEPNHPSADQVFTHGVIYTVDKQQPWAEGLAIVGDNIAYVGTTAGLQSWIGPATRITNLQGRFLLPGFVDSHSHIFLGAAHIDDLLLDQFDPVETWLKEIGEFARLNPHRDVIVGSGFLASSFGHEGPSRHLIDSVVPDRPVFIMDEGMHGAWLNSAALKQLGINASTPDPTPGFDYYKRDAQGNPTGYLLEGTLWQAMKDLNLVNVDSLTENTAEVIQLFNSYGITAVFDAGPWEAEEIQVDILESLQTNDQLSIRFAGSYYIDDAADIDTVIGKVKALQQRTQGTPYPVSTLKIMVDGTLEGRTAAMFEDYQGDPGNQGTSVLTPEQLSFLVSEAVTKDLDIHFHALGERAISESLDAIGVALSHYPESTSRFTLSHIQLMARSDVARFSRYKVVAQSTPLWAKHDAEGRVFITEDQFNRYYLFNSLDKAGVKLSFGSDFPSTGAGNLGISPLYNIEIGHTRQYPGRPEAPIQPPMEERLTIAQLIEAYTINGAYQMRLDDQIGSITPGKKADLVLLAENPFTTETYSLHKIPVLQTWVGGKTVYLHPGEQRSFVR